MQLLAQTGVYIIINYANFRYGFSTPPNYNDHELYCGGFSRQWRTNGGKCGICGDPWDTRSVWPEVREL